MLLTTVKSQKDYDKRFGIFHYTSMARNEKPLNKSIALHEILHCNPSLPVKKSVIHS